MKTAAYQVDLNCDLGEGYGNDADIMPLIHSCNIACGGHAGDESSIEKTLLLAAEYKVRAGVHPSYPDRENFGRKTMDLEGESLLDSLLEQSKSFLQIAKDLKVKVYHLKPHGALYNKAATDESTAHLIVKLIKELQPDLILYAPCNSVLERIGRNEGLEVWSEAFLDRNYNKNSELVPRQQEGASIADVNIIRKRLRDMILRNQLITIEGEVSTIRPQTFCVHGDNPNTPAVLKAVQEELNRINLWFK